MDTLLLIINGIKRQWEFCINSIYAPSTSSELKEMSKGIQSILMNLPNVFVAEWYPSISPSKMHELISSWKQLWMYWLRLPSYFVQPKYLL